MVHDSKSSADVVIVGSGVAGAIVALELAKAGIDTMMLEAGPRLQRWQIVERFRSSPAKGDFQAPYPPSVHAPHPQYSPPNDYVIQKGQDPYIAGYIRAVGGTTLHWNAIAPRFLPSDFRVRREFGVGRDWPFGYDDIEADYYRAELELGVAGNLDDDHGSPRTRPFPMDGKPLLSYLDLRVQQVLGEKGWKVVPDIVARNSRPYDGRPACEGNNTCAPICPIAAQYSAGDTVRKAEEAGATLVTDAVVHRVELGPDGRVAAVSYLDPQGTEHRITGRYFVLAANAIEIPKLLLMSEGVANSSDQVGRNLMDHPGSSITFYSSEPLWSGRGPQRNSYIEGMRDGPFRSDYAAAKMNVGNYNRIRQVTEELVKRGVYGAELDGMIADLASRQISFTGLYEQLPDPENRIVPSAEHKDALGLPRPEITWRIEDYVRTSDAKVKEHFTAFAEMLGGTEAVFGDGFSSNNHIMGTTIMGDDPADSVVDRDCRTHDHDNLFVASSSVFPSGSTVNPTLTIAALSYRIADTLREAMQ